MFAPVVQNRLLLRDREANRIRCGDFASVMNRSRAGKEDDLPSCLPAAAAPIHVVAIHEEVFVEQAHFVEGLAADHREASHDHIHGQCPVVGKVEHVLAGEQFGILERRCQSRGRTEIVPKRGRPPAGALLGHVRIEHAGTNISYLGILGEEIGQSIQAFLKHDHVWIDQSDITSLALAYAEVVALGEAQVLAAADDFDAGEPRFDHLRRAVNRGVIDHDYFHTVAWRRIGQALKAELQIVLGIPTDDDN